MLKVPYSSALLCLEIYRPRNTGNGNPVLSLFRLLYDVDLAYENSKGTNPSVSGLRTQEQEYSYSTVRLRFLSPPFLLGLLSSPVTDTPVATCHRPCESLRCGVYKHTLSQEDVFFFFPNVPIYLESLPKSGL